MVTANRSFANKYHFYHYYCLFYTQALLNYTLNIFILKEKMVYKIMNTKNARTLQIVGAFSIKIVKFKPVSV